MGRSTGSSLDDIGYRLVDQWHKTSKAYAATFREDLTVRKHEFIQVLRCTHPHWVWIRNEESNEGFVPIDCLMAD